jgi:hypothetical protein
VRNCSTSPISEAVKSLIASKSSLRSDSNCWLVVAHGFLGTLVGKPVMMPPPSRGLPRITLKSIPSRVPFTTVLPPRPVTNDERGSVATSEI